VTHGSGRRAALLSEPHVLAHRHLDVERTDPAACTPSVSATMRGLEAFRHTPHGVGRWWARTIAEYIVVLPARLTRQSHSRIRRTASWRPHVRARGVIVPNPLTASLTFSPADLRLSSLLRRCSWRTCSCDSDIMRKHVGCRGADPRRLSSVVQLAQQKGIRSCGASSASGTTTNARSAILGWGHGELGRFQLEFVVCEQIDVDQAWSPAPLWPTTETLLDRDRLAQQRFWRELCLQDAAQVQEPRLIRISPRLGLVHRRHRFQLTKAGQFCQRGARHAKPIAEVASQAEIDGRHAGGVSQVQ
jgi:hypothetical protein